MSQSLAICERCPYCGSGSLESLPHETITRLRILAYLRCRDCGTSFEPTRQNVSAAIHPHIGDLIVRHRRDTDGFVVTLLGASASQERYCANRDYAVALAASTAAPLQSDVWETNDGLTFELVTSYSMHA